MINERKFRVIHSFLHFDGKRCQDLTPHQHLHLFTMADGYGKCSAQDLIANDLTWDWSHVRDSSDEALNVIFSELVSMGKAVD